VLRLGKSWNCLYKVTSSLSSYELPNPISYKPTLFCKVWHNISRDHACSEDCWRFRHPLTLKSGRGTLGMENQARTKGFWLYVPRSSCYALQHMRVYLVGRVAKGKYHLALFPNHPFLSTALRTIPHITSNKFRHSNEIKSPLLMGTTPR
jgi:hypothetical protein